MRHIPYILKISIVALCVYVGATYVYAAFPQDQFSLLQAQRTTGFNLGAECFQQLKRFGCDTGNVICTPKIQGPANGQEGGGLNPEFACRLVKYFQAHPEQRIVSAYRSFAKQQSLCGSGGKGCAPPGKSCHQYGLAVDVSGIKLGVKQKELGLIRAYSGPHLQCEENSTASCSKDTVPCSGKFTDQGNSFQNQDKGAPEQTDVPPPSPQQTASAQPQSQPGAADVPYKSEPVQVGSLGETVQAPTTVAEKNGYNASCADVSTCKNAKEAKDIITKKIPDPFTPTHVTTEQVPKKKSSGTVQQAELNGGIRYIVPTYSDIPRTNSI